MHFYECDGCFRQERMPVRADIPTITVYVAPGGGVNAKWAYRQAWEEVRDGHNRVERESRTLLACSSECKGRAIRNARMKGLIINRDSNWSDQPRPARPPVDGGRWFDLAINAVRAR